MKKSVLEKYYQKGWLKKGNKNVSAEERLCAGYVFYKSYVTSHVLSVGVVDLEKPAVDGGVRFNSVEGKIGQKESFLKAYQQIPKNCRQIVEIVVLQNKTVQAQRHDVPLLKAMLCAALDGLVNYYLTRVQADEK